MLKKVNEIIQVLLEYAIEHDVTIKSAWNDWDEPMEKWLSDAVNLRLGIGNY